MSLRGILTNVMASKVEISYRTILFAFALVAGLWLVLQIRDILFHDHFPVDIRHNAKIDRDRLSRWAEARLG